MKELTITITIDTDDPERATFIVRTLDALLDRFPERYVRDAEFRNTDDPNADPSPLADQDSDLSEDLTVSE